VTYVTRVPFIVIFLMKYSGRC